MSECNSSFTELRFSCCEWGSISVCEIICSLSAGWLSLCWTLYSLHSSAAPLHVVVEVILISPGRSVEYLEVLLVGRISYCRPNLCRFGYNSNALSVFSFILGADSLNLSDLSWTWTVHPVCWQLIYTLSNTLVTHINVKEFIFFYSLYLLEVTLSLLGELPLIEGGKAIHSSQSKMLSKYFFDFGKILQWTFH